MPIRVAVWDPLLRLFHALLILAVAAAFIAVELGGSAMLWHGRLGVVLAGLLAFRLVWGVIGPATARFSHFVQGPKAVIAYLRTGQAPAIGHNPLGALSVVAMLSLLTLQVLLGLFAYDEISYRGPLAPLLDETWQLRFTSWHRQLKGILLLLIALHIGAVLFYRIVKKRDLITPMITGFTWVEQPLEKPPVCWKDRGYLLRGALAVGVGLLAAWLASGVWLSSAQTPLLPTPEW